MISLTDTSVFVAAFDQDHPQHPRSLAHFNKLARADAKCSAHTLAEVYSVLTRLPKPHRLSAEQAAFFVEQILERVEPIALDANEYVATLRMAGQKGIPGGRVYDALHLAVARKIGAEAIYTWDIDDFRAVARDLAERIIEP